MASMTTILEITIPIAGLLVLLGALSSDRVQNALLEKYINFDNPFRQSYGTLGPYKPMQRYENYRDSDSGYETANSFSEGGSKNKTNKNKTKTNKNKTKTNKTNKNKTKTNKTRNKQKFL
jgi:hypothetical protein